MNPVLGAARQLTGTVYAAREAARPPAAPLPPQRVRHGFTGRAVNLEPVEGKRLEQVFDGGTAVDGKVHREYVTQLDTRSLFIVGRSHAGTTSTRNRS